MWYIIKSAILITILPPSTFYRTLHHGKWIIFLLDKSKGEFRRQRNQISSPNSCRWCQPISILSGTISNVLAMLMSNIVPSILLGFDFQLFYGRCYHLHSNLANYCRFQLCIINICNYHIHNHIIKAKYRNIKSYKHSHWIANYFLITAHKYVVFDEQLGHTPSCNKSIKMHYVHIGHFDWLALK